MTTLRNLLKYKTHSALTILGLAVGFAASAIILIVNYTELSYDNHWADAERIYQVEAIVKFNSQATKQPMVPAVFYELLKTQVPEIEAVTRWTATGTKVRYASGAKEENTFEERMASVDDSFFDIFNFPVSVGNLKDFYADNASVIISVDLATKLFGNDNPIGKIVTIDVTNINNTTINAGGSNAREQRKKNYKVVSVISNELHKSSIPSPNMYIHIENDKLMETKKEGNISHSFTYSYQIYIKAKKDVDIAKLKKSLPAIQDHFIAGKIELYDKKPSEFF
jgi:putative ABC transport system permease protein